MPHATWLEVNDSRFTHMRFEPSGMTNDPDIRAAKSIVDYIFRWVGKKVPDRRPAEGDRHPVGRGASPPSGGLPQRRRRASIDQSAGGDGATWADRALFN